MLCLFYLNYYCLLNFELFLKPDEGFYCGGEFHFSFKISNLPLSSQISNLHSSDWSRLTNKNKNSALNKILLSGEVFWIAGSYFYERVPWSRDEYACCNLLKQSVLVIIRHSIQILRQD